MYTTDPIHAGHRCIIKQAMRRAGHAVANDAPPTDLNAWAWDHPAEVSAILRHWLDRQEQATSEYERERIAAQIESVATLFRVQAS